MVPRICGLSWSAVKLGNAWRFIELGRHRLQRADLSCHRHYFRGAVMVNSALLLPFSPSGPSCWLSLTCTVIRLVPGICCRPGKLILGLPVRGRCIVDQEPVRDRIGFRITGLCRPGNSGSQDLRALLICIQAGNAGDSLSMTGISSQLRALMVNSTLLFPFSPCGPSCWLSLTCTVIRLVPGSVAVQAN